MTAEDIKELKELAGRISLPQILRAVKRFGQLDLSLDNYSTLPLELALVDATLTDNEPKATPAANSDPPASRTTHNTQQPPSNPRPPVSEERKNTPPISNPVPPNTAQAAPSQAPATATNYEHTNQTPQPAAGQDPPRPAQRSTTINPLGAGSAIEQLQQHWNKIINESPGGLSKTAAAALLRTSRPVSIDGDTIVISMKYAYHKEKMDSLDNQKIADKIVSSFMGRTCRVRCVYEHENNHLVKAALSRGAQVINTEEP
jgi:hypothetical protein